MPNPWVWLPGELGADIAVSVLEEDDELDDEDWDDEDWGEEEDEEDEEDEDWGDEEDDEWHRNGSAEDDD